MMMDARRRRFLSKVVSTTGLTLVSPWVMAKDAEGWPAHEFSLGVSSQVIDAISPSRPKLSSEVIVLGPHIVEDGKVVPISVNTTLQHVRKITLVVPRNPLPLAGIFEIPEGTEPNIAARLKLAGDTDVVALVETPDGVFQGSKHVKVTRGGCGG